MKRNYLSRLEYCLLFLSVCLAIGCKKNADESLLEKSKSNLLAINNARSKIESVSVERSRELMENFAKLLRNAVKEDTELRRFLKNEALKKFDLDYDVLYGMIKDNVVSNNQTFRERLLKYVNNEQELLEYEQQFPFLTIYVPELPNFSAETWNVSSEVPGVSTGVLDADRLVTYYLKDGSQEQKPVDLVPGFPLLVIKNNERVILSEQALKMKLPYVNQLSANGNSYVFLSESFNGS